MCYRSKNRVIYDNLKNSSCFTTFHPYCLRFSCDAIMQPASTGCSSRVWEFPTTILQCKIRVCGAQCSNESPSGAFKRQNGLRQQMEGPCPNKFADVYTSALLAGTMKLLDVLPSLKIILQARPSASKFNLKRTVIFLHKNFRICNRRKQGKPVPSRNF